MSDKLLYEIGNLYTGYPYGVEAERNFGCVDLYGPFNSENKANTFMHELAEQNDSPYVSIKIVKIVTAEVESKRIVREHIGSTSVWSYAV